MDKSTTGKVKFNRIKFNNKAIDLSVDLTGNLEDIALRNEDKVSLVMRYRGKLAEENQEIRSKRGAFTALPDGQVRFQAVIDFTDPFKLRPIYWDLLFCIEDGERLYEEPVQYGEFNKKVRNPFYMKCCYWKETGMFLYPYIKDGHISFQYRKKNQYDTTGFRLKEIMILAIYKIFHKHWDRKNICLIYEKYCSMAQDNGYYFFKYCMEHNAEKLLNKNIYYVIDKKSQAMSKLNAYEKNVIDFMSIKHIFYAVSAKLLVSTDSKEHVYMWRKRHSIINGIIKKKPLVFLQHGVIALKDVRIPYSKKQAGQCELFIVSSKKEKEIITSQYGYMENEVAVTGLARWDVLCDKSAGHRDILVMATWRNWLDAAEGKTFADSEYYQKYSELINSKELENVLIRTNCNVKFYVHAKLKEYVSAFTSSNERVEIIAFGDRSLNELLMECNMLVTDYSSVSWDMFYQRKPVVFYQFDLESYLEAHGSHIDMDKDLFGQRTENIDELIEILEENIYNDFKLDEKYEAKYDDAFAYVDNDNSKRILEIIKERF